MSILDHALKSAEKGFYIFRLKANSKTPLSSGWQNEATRDPSTIKKWFSKNPNLNYGIYAGKFGVSDALLIVDVDNKGEKKGDEEVFKLELEGFEFPKTYSQFTPTGGKHYVYRIQNAVKQSVGKIAPGLDIRSRGGYVVGSGSIISGKSYTLEEHTIIEAPAWLIEKCGKPKQKEEFPGGIVGLNSARAVERAIHYLESEAPIATQGQGGDQTTFQVAAHFKDLGVELETCFALLLTLWNPKCEPPWALGELRTKVENAYKYGIEPQGVLAPEAQFQPSPDPTADTPLHPFEVLNQEFAFVLAGGGSHILWETTGPHGEFRLEHLGIQAFHQKLAAKSMTIGDGKTKPVSELWMKSPERRSFDGICFMPGLESPKRFYNLWRGFSVEPAPVFAASAGLPADGLSMFLAHARLNVCQGDEELFNWLIGYFAHLVQKPWEKPLVSLVFRGGKGVGKNALVDRVGHLLGSHYLLTSNRRYLVGNFNGHLENLLLFALDEAFWSGDKQAEGTLKDLITGKNHVIEHKGKETYTVANCTRVIIIGNEEWLVPASQDERRFAVFDVGDGRKQDRDYFQRMREAMEAGGYRLLLRFLLDVDLSKVDVNAAPQTKALLDQKISSLDIVHQWWLACLTEGRIVGSDFGDDWPAVIGKERFRQAFRRYFKERQIRSRVPDDIATGKLLKACLPSLNNGAKQRDGSQVLNAYKLPTLLQCRLEWERFIGHPISWD